MFERIVNWIKGAISKMFNTTDIAKDFNIDISKSWIIGDDDNDILAGKNAGCNTYKIQTNNKFC